MLLFARLLIFGSFLCELTIYYRNFEKLFSFYPIQELLFSLQILLTWVIAVSGISSKENCRSWFYAIFLTKIFQRLKLFFFKRVFRLIVFVKYFDRLVLWNSFHNVSRTFELETSCFIHIGLVFIVKHTIIWLENFAKIRSNLGHKCNFLITLKHESW